MSSKSLDYIADEWYMEWLVNSRVFFYRFLMGGIKICSPHQDDAGLGRVFGKKFPLKKKTPKTKTDSFLVL